MRHLLNSWYFLPKTNSALPLSYSSTKYPKSCFPPRFWQLHHSFWMSVTFSNKPVGCALLPIQPPTRRASTVERPNNTNQTQTKQLIPQPIQSTDPLPTDNKATQTRATDQPTKTNHCPKQSRSTSFFYSRSSHRYSERSTVSSNARRTQRFHRWDIWRKNSTNNLKISNLVASILQALSQALFLSDNITKLTNTYQQQSLRIFLYII